jgi:hypothetical protein
MFRIARHYDLGKGPIGYTGRMTEPSARPGPLARAQVFGIETRARREVALFGGALALGLLVIPSLIWIIGRRTLGPYTHGDSLAHGWLGYWAVALGPAVLLLATRLWLAALRRLSRD